MDIIYRRAHTAWASYTITHGIVNMSYVTSDQYVSTAIAGIERIIVQANIVDEEDKHNITDVFTLFFRSLSDPAYNICGIGASMDNSHLQYTYEAGMDKSPFFTVGVVGITELSMRSLKCLENHDGVYDIYVEAIDRQNARKTAITTVLSIAIRLFKSTMLERVKYVWTPHYFIDINDNITGLIINRHNKDTAQRIVREVMNMDKDGVEPTWSNKLSNDPGSYLLCASPVKKFTLSFYVHMRTMFPDIINTVIKIDEANRSLGFAYLMIIIHCALAERTTDDTVADKRRTGALHKTSSVGNTIRSAKTDHDRSWFETFKRSFYKE